MTVKKFEFKKTYEEFEAGEKAYRMYFDDERLKQYRSMIDKYKGIADKKIPDIETLSLEEQDAIEAEHVGYMEEMINTFLGEGSYKELYEASGRSTLNMADLVYFLIEFVEHRTANMQNEKVYNYYKKKATE